MNALEVSVDSEMISSVRRFFEQECPVELVRHLHCHGDKRMDALWEQIALMGLPGALLDEEDQGLAFGVRDSVLLAEEAGRVLLPLPLLNLMSTLPFLLQELNIQLAKLGPVLDDWRTGQSWPGFALPDGNDHWFVEYAYPDQRALAMSWADDVLTLGLLEPVKASTGMDGSMRTAKVERTSELCAATHVPCSEDVWQRHMSRTRLLRLAELLGVAVKSLEDAVAYAGERTQFGRAIGSNQAIKHSLADRWMMIDNARLCIANAARLYDEKADVELAIHYAQVVTIEAARSTTRYAIQVFGAMGITWECNAHLFLKRAQYLCAVLERDLPTAAALDKIWACG